MNRSNLFEVLAEPNRRTMLDLMRVRERTVGELVEHLPLSQPGVSKHLRILREAGLVALRKDAKQHWYRLNPMPLQEIHQWFEPYRQFWSDKLDELERRMDADAAIDAVGPVTGGREDEREERTNAGRN